MSKVFNLNTHYSKLREIEDQLRRNGQYDEAADVETARILLIDFETRIHSGIRLVRELRDISLPPDVLANKHVKLEDFPKTLDADEVRRCVYDLERYTTYRRGPWIGCVLFPEDPDDK